MTGSGQPPIPHANNAVAAPGVAAPSNIFVCLSNGLSSTRMGRYLKGAGFDETRAVKMYLWNVALSEAFNLPLHVLEVTLRNRIHAMLQSSFVDDWHLHQALTRRLEDKLCLSLGQAQSRVERQYTTCSIDQMVATLSFGFWTALLNDAYLPLLWRSSLQAVFPNMPGNYALRDARIIIAGSHWFRNRIAHHEPIFEEDLSKRYSDAMKALAWLDGNLASWVRAHTRVPAIIRMKP